MGELKRLFPPTPIQNDSVSVNPELTGEVIRFFYAHDLNENYCTMLESYLNDTLVTTSPTIEESGNEVVASGDSWFRRFIIAENQLVEHETRLGRTIERMPNITCDQNQIDLRDLSAMWLFYEGTADMLSEVHSMQRKFGKYVPDHPAITKDGKFSASFAEFDRINGGLDISAEEKYHAVTLDHRRYRAGIALLQLRDELLRQGVVDTYKKSQWIYRALIGNYVSSASLFGLPPKNELEIIGRHRNLTPTQTRYSTLYPDLVDFED